MFIQSPPNKYTHNHGGRYCLSFHTIDPLYQMHIAVPDHRIPTYESKELVHRSEPFIVAFFLCLFVSVCRLLSLSLSLSLSWVTS